MFGFSAKLVQRPDVAKILKQVNYGTAVGLTKTAKEGQAAVQGALRGKFTIRNRWLEQQTPVGIKITPATPAKLMSEIKTAARFLPLQETGGNKIPYGNHIAIPAKNGPINRSRVIPAAMRPKALIDSGRAFKIWLKSGVWAIAARDFKTRGKFKGFTILYFLVPRAHLKRADIWEQPIRKVIDRRLNSNIAREVELALQKMR